MTRQRIRPSLKRSVYHECEHCGDTTKRGGYDDDYFHKNVIPAMECKSCGKSAPETYRPLATKYPEGMTV